MSIELLPEQPGHTVQMGNIDLFVWKSEDMKGDREVAVHRLNIKPNAKPIKRRVVTSVNNRMRL